MARTVQGESPHSHRVCVRTVSSVEPQANERDGEQKQSEVDEDAPLHPSDGTQAPPAGSACQRRRVAQLWTALALVRRLRTIRSNVAASAGASRVGEMRSM